MPSSLDLLARYGAAGMLNARSAGEPKMMEAYARTPLLPLVLDSGACQGNRNVEGYAQLLRRLGHRLDWCASLDVLHNQESSDVQYRQLCALLAHEDEIRRKVLYIYQCQSHGNTWSPKGDLEALQRALDTHRAIGIGGLVSVIERNMHEAMDILGVIGERLDQAEATCHLFGVGNYSLLVFACAHHWFRSADSSRWLQGVKSRLLLTCDGKSLSAKNLTFTGMQCNAQNVGAVLSWLEPGVMHQLSLFPEPDEGQEQATAQASVMRKVARRQYA